MFMTLEGRVSVFSGRYGVRVKQLQPLLKRIHLSPRCQRAVWSMLIVGSVFLFVLYQVKSQGAFY